MSSKRCTDIPLFANWQKVSIVLLIAVLLVGTASAGTYTLAPGDSVTVPIALHDMSELDAYGSATHATKRMV